jgi:hypothetical protein
MTWAAAWQHKQVEGGPRQKETMGNYGKIVIQPTKMIILWDL